MTKAENIEIVSTKIQNSPKKSDGLFHSVVYGITPLGEFVEKQQLLQLAMKNRAIYEKKVNEGARLLQERYWAFRQQLDKGRVKQKREEAFQEWKKTFIQFLGYSDALGFDKRLVPLNENASILVASSANHSCAIVDISHAESADIDLDVQFDLSLLPCVELKARNLRKTGISEVSDLVLRAGGGFTDVLVLTTSHLYWFSADVVTHGSCLEVSLEDIFQPDEEIRLAFLSFLLGQDAFRRSIDEVQEEDETNSVTSSAASDDEDEEEAGSVGSSGPSVTTRAQKFLQEDLESKRQITEELHQQVTIALELLVNHRLQQEPQRIRGDKAAEDLSQALFKDGLFFVYRILFILFAESKGILRLTMKEYASFYSMESVLDWCDGYPRNVRLGRIDPDGHYIWNSLCAIFTVLRRGVDLKGEGKIPAFNGQLFSPDQCMLFDNGPALCDKVLVQVLTHLTTREVGQYRERVNFANLEIGQLGVVYEALLAQRPKYLKEDHVWVEAHGGGLGLVPRTWIKALGGTLEYKVVDCVSLNDEDKKLCRNSMSKLRRNKFDEFISSARPALRPSKGTFVICPSGGARRQTASFYTPQKLADYLAYRTLKPLIEAAKSPEDILKITVLEPSVGCGSFLVSAMKILARALIEKVTRDARPSFKISGIAFTKQNGELSESALNEAKRLVLENCLYGVDTNGLSLELCRVILYLESLTSDRPLPFLHNKLKQGNALIGADLRARFAQDFQGDKINWAFIPSSAVFGTQREFLKSKNNDASIYGGYAEAATLHGNKVPSVEEVEAALAKAEGQIKAAKQNLFSGKKGEEVPKVEFVKWCATHQTAILNLLDEVAALEDRFAKMQMQAGGVDRQDDLFRDFASMLPESDPLLIEADGVPVSEEMKYVRKEALEREFGAKVYAALVQGARATQRLRAFANYASALQTWPLDLMKKFPSFEDYQ
jgi:hypothetical protein